MSKLNVPPAPLGSGLRYRSIPTGYTRRIRFVILSFLGLETLEDNGNTGTGYGLNVCYYRSGCALELLTERNKQLLLLKKDSL